MERAGLNLADLTEEQPAALYQGEQVSNLECAPGGICSYPAGTGIAGSELVEEQRQLLLDVVHGSADLAKELAAAGLVDWHHLLVLPLLLGAGRRLSYDTTGTLRTLELVEDEACSTGVVKTVHDVVH